MNISICITVLNEEESISKLLDSLLLQSKKASEIVMVDGGSKDKTVEIIRHYQKKYPFIKLVVEKSSRAKARNITCEIAKSEIIAMTDAGCVADRDWLKNITKPFETDRVDVVAGFYHMQGSEPCQKAMSVFMGVTPRKFDHKFLPSTRSIAFTKKIWEEVGGFPENVAGTAEDTLFNKKLIDNGAKFSRMKNATVEWGMPITILNFQLSIFNYTKGDAKSRNWIFPGKGSMSHNIKVLSVFARYLFALASLLYILLFNHPMLVYWAICLFAYLAWAFRKVYLEFGDWKVSLWGPVLQIISDISVMTGFISGYF